VQAAAQVESAAGGVFVGLIDEVAGEAEGEGEIFGDVVAEAGRSGGEVVLAPADVGDVGAGQFEGPGAFVERLGRGGGCGRGWGDVGNNGLFAKKPRMVIRVSKFEFGAGNSSEKKDDSTDS
jgi:hypothetical protein